MPKTWPTSFASTSNVLGAASRRPSQTNPGCPRPIMRAEGPSGLMKVRSTADLLAGRGFVVSGTSVPENPVTTALPGARLGEWVCAPAPVGMMRNNAAENTKSRAKSRALSFDMTAPPSLSLAAERNLFSLVAFFPIRSGGSANSQRGKAEEPDMQHTTLRRRNLCVKPHRNGLIASWLDDAVGLTAISKQ